MILTFKEYLQEASNCPDGKKYCPKCQMCVEKTCEEKKMMKEAAWTKKEGQNKEGGLNEKGRKSYERENPGSDLKAPSKKKGKNPSGEGETSATKVRGGKLPKKTKPNSTYHYGKKK